jgi:hypothetical protein
MQHEVLLPMRRGELLEREKGKLTKSNDTATPLVFATMS